MSSPASRLVLDLLSAVSGRAIPVRALVRAADVFDITENNLRVALARLVADGKVERNERGFYELGKAAEPVQRRVSSWSRLSERVVAWNGGWLGVHLGPALRDRTRARRQAMALEFLGMRRLEQGLYVRPDNLAGGVEAVRAELGELGLGPRALVMSLSGLDDATEKRARGLWNAAELERGYRDTVERLKKSTATLDALPIEQAVVECFVLGGRAIRQLAKDPLLPEPLVRAALRSALTEEMRRYDKVGRRVWRRFMTAEGAPALESLLSFRHVEGNA